MSKGYGAEGAGETSARKLTCGCAIITPVEPRGRTSSKRSIEKTSCKASMRSAAEERHSRKLKRRISPWRWITQIP
jgi:hypothetical protein